MKKRIVAIAMTALMALSLGACSGQKTTREDTGNTTVQSTSAAAAQTADPTASKQRKNPYTDDIKIAYVAHDLSTPNNQAWLEGIERE